jgi:ABC-2 type transport system ATP-binding protein
VIVRKKVIGLLLESLSESNRTALIASHNLNELEHIIDRALLIKGKTIEGDYRLETIREQSRKLQLVFRSKQIPPLIKQHSKLIQKQGRVLTALFDNYTEELAAEIQQLDPLVFEELPLTLEDLFEANLRQEALVEG